MTTADPGSRFELRDATGDAIPDVLGLWYVVPTELAFDTPTTTGERDPQVVWSVTLPADPALARASLVDAERQLAVAEQALLASLLRLEGYVPLVSGDLAFDLPDRAAALHQPEARLRALLDELRNRGDGEDVVFDIGCSEAGTWQQVNEEFRAFIHRLHQNITHYAAVQTRVGDSLIAYSVVGRSGDTDTVWRAGVSAVHMQLHQRALALSLTSRAKMLRMFALATRGGAILAGALATPVGTVLSVSAAWRFIRDVVTELRGEEQ